MGARVAPTHPPQEFPASGQIRKYIDGEKMGSVPIIYNKVREDKLVRVEPEGCNREGKNGYPEINQVRGPECQCHVEEHDECPHAQVNTWTSKTGEEDVEVDTGCCKSTACRNVTRVSECEISED